VVGQLLAVDPDRRPVVDVPLQLPVTGDIAVDAELEPRDPDLARKVSGRPPGRGQSVGIERIVDVDP